MTAGFYKHYVYVRTLEWNIMSDSWWQNVMSRLNTFQTIYVSRLTFISCCG